MLNVGFFKILPQLLNFSLSLLVQLQLSSSCSSGFIKALTKTLKLSGQIRTLPPSFSTSLSFSLKFFFKLFNSALILFDSLLNLRNQRLLIFKFGIECRNILFLPGNNILQLSFVLLNVRHSLLSHLQLTLNFPPLFFNISTSSLLSIGSI